MKKTIYSFTVISILTLTVSSFAHDMTTAFVKLADKVNPAVVNIRTTQLPKRPAYRDPFMDLFEEFYGFNPRQRKTQPSNALGTGFIIDKSGLIITNNHVIDEADEIEVQLSENSKKTYKAKVIGKDKKTDLALIKINTGSELPIIKLGSSGSTKVGEWVAAFGNPLGLGHTMTKGIVSAKGREVDEIGLYPFIQTDASINPGNSGGPLVNLSGEVIGVNTFIIRGAQGLGFAIPIDAVKSLLPQLKEKGKVTRGFLGVAINEINPMIQKEFGLKTDKGVLVTEVYENTPAALAKIEPYDVIIKVGPKNIENAKQLQNAIARHPIGTPLEVEFIRNRKNKTTTIHLTEKQAEEVDAPAKLSKLNAPYKLGFEVANLTNEMANLMRIPYVPKPVIYSIDHNSPAARAGLSVGDIILDINRKNVNNAKQAVRALKKRSNLIRIQRGNYIFVLFLES